MLRIGPNASSDEQSAINIRTDTQRIGVQKNPTGEYILDVSGSINCDSIFVGGSEFTGSGGGSSVWTQDGTTGDISYGGGNVSISGDLHVIGDISGYIYNDTNYTTSTASLVSYSSTSSSLAGVWTQDDTTGDISYGDGNVFIGEGLDVSGYLKLPFGSSDVSSATYEGYIRYNDVSNVYQGYDASNNVWSSLGAGSTFDSITESAEPLYNYLRIYREDYTGNDIILNGLQVWDNSVNLISSGIDSSVNFYDSSGGTTITQAVVDEFGDVSDVVDASTSTIGSYAQIAFTSPLPNYNDLQAIYMVSPNTTDYELSGCKVQLLTSQETILAESDVLGSSANYLLRGPVAITSSASSIIVFEESSWTFANDNLYTLNGWSNASSAANTTIDIGNGYEALFDNNWSSVRDYFHGVNNVGTTGTVTVLNLDPNTAYKLGFYIDYLDEYTSYDGTNQLSVGGNTYTYDQTIDGESSPSWTGTVTSDGNGEIVLTFTKLAQQQPFSGLEVQREFVGGVLFSSPSDIIAWTDFSANVEDVSLNQTDIKIPANTVTIDGDLNVTSVLYVSEINTTNEDLHVGGSVGIGASPIVGLLDVQGSGPETVFSTPTFVTGQTYTIKLTNNTPANKFVLMEVKVKNNDTDEYYTLTNATVRDDSYDSRTPDVVYDGVINSVSNRWHSNALADTYEYWSADLSLNSPNYSVEVYYNIYYYSSGQGFFIEMINNEGTTIDKIQGGGAAADFSSHSTYTDAPSSYWIYSGIISMKSLLPPTHKIKITQTAASTALVLMEVKIKDGDGNYYTLTQADASSNVTETPTRGPFCAIDGVIDNIFNRYSSSASANTYEWWSAGFTPTSANNTVELFYQDSGGGFTIEIIEISSGNVVSTNTYDLSEGSSNPSDYTDLHSSYLYSGEIGMTDVTANVSIRATSNILTGGSFSTYSDERIKTNIVDISDNESLELLRKIKPKKYEYRDKISRSSDVVYGYIAQEVKEVMPYAIDIIAETIPNVFEYATVNETTLTFEAFNTADLEGSSSTIKLIDHNNKEYNTTFSILDTSSITIDLNLNGVNLHNNKIFVYGQSVKDFHTLVKERINVVAVSALQELDTQVQTLQAENDALQTELTDLKALLQSKGLLD